MSNMDVSPATRENCVDDTLRPMRLMDRNERQLPTLPGANADKHGKPVPSTCAELRRDKPLPTREKDLRDNADPSSTKSSTDILDPMRAMPKREMALPNRRKDRHDKAEPTEKKSNTEVHSRPE
jgi:hypothetical protein